MSANGKRSVKKRGSGWGGKREGAGPPGNRNGMTHGAKALEVLLKQSLPLDHPIGRLLAHRRDLYVADLGGVANVSNMEAGLIERLAKLDLYEALLDARLVNPVSGRSRKLSWSRFHALGLLRVRLTDSYTRTAAALGIKRRERPIPELADLLRAAAKGGNPDA